MPVGTHGVTTFLATSRPTLLPWRPEGPRPSKAEREPRRKEKGRSVRGASKLGPQSSIPDQPRRQLVSDTQLRSDGGRFAASGRLLGEHIADERRSGELRCAEGIARAEGQLVPPVALIIASRGQEF